MRRGERYVYLYDGRKATITNITDGLVFVSFEDGKRGWYAESTFRKYFRHGKEQVLALLSSAILALVSTLIVQQVLGSSEWVLVLLFFLSWVVIHFGMARIARGDAS